MSHRVFCPHCDVKLKFKKLPQEALDCPKCHQPIEAAYFQSAVDATAPGIEESPPTDPAPPEPSEDAETYSFAAPAPEPTPARSAVDDDLAERIERQSKPKKNKKKKHETTEDPDEPGSSFEAGIMGLFGSAFFLFYGGYGGGVTFLHIIDFSPGFIFGTGVVMAVVSMLLLAFGIYEIIQEGYSETVKDKYTPLKYLVCGLLIVGMVYFVFVTEGDDEPAPEENDTSVTSNSEANSTPQRAANSNRNLPPNNTNNRRQSGNSAGASRTNRRPQADRSTTEVQTDKPKAPESVPLKMLVRVPPDAFPLERYQHLLIPEGASADAAQTVRTEADEIELEVRSYKDHNGYQNQLQLRGLIVNRVNAYRKNNRIQYHNIELTAPSRSVARESDLELPFNDLILKHFHFLPHKERYDLNRAFPEEDLQEMYGRDRHTSEMEGELYIPERVGGPGPIIGAECIMGSSDGQECPYRFILHTKPFSAESEHPVFVTKEGYVLTTLRVCCDGPNGVVLGVRPGFSRYSDGVADPDDWYQGEPIGTMRDDGRRYPCGDMGRRHIPVIGLTCLTGDNCLNAIGLVWKPQPSPEESPVD